MKKIISFTLLITTIISCNAQSNDALLMDQITISSFPIQQTTQSLISHIGNPDSITDYDNEIDNETWLDYKYSGNSFYFFNNQQVSFDLKTDSFYFYNSSIKVGNNIAVINTFFPNSYTKREVLNNLGFIIIDINMPDDTPSDAFIVINYNSVTNIISSIHMGSR